MIIIRTSHTDISKKMNALKIYKTYPFEGYYRWICEKVIVDDFEDHELSSPIYRGRCDVVVAVKFVEDVADTWLSINPFATELFKSVITGDCLIVFEDIEKVDDFDLWCEIIKRDLINLGCRDVNFKY